MAGPPPILPGETVEVCVGDPDDRSAACDIAPAFGGRIVPAAGDVLVCDEWTAEHAPHVRVARERGARITTLAGLIIARHDGPWVGVTGTAGKSSTCHALAHVLRATGSAVRITTTARSGNAWPDWSLVGDGAPPGAVLVAELTSSHLCHMDAPLAPDVAVITLIRADHPDLHPTHGAYVAAKARLLPPAGAPRTVVVPADDPDTLAALPSGVSGDFHFGVARGPGPGAYLREAHAVDLVGREAETVALLGDGPATHRRAILAAAAAALALGTDVAPLAVAMAAVPGPAHRQHLAGRFRGAWVIDDTLAATPRKVTAAVDEYAGRDPVVVLGGEPVEHPGGDMEMALADIGRRGLRVVTFGAMAPTIGRMLTPVATAPTVMGALAIAATVAGDDGLVLVSPMFAMPPAERERVAALPERSPLRG